MSEILATGRIDIDLNDKDAIAGLRALDAAVDKSFRNIEGKEAEIDVKGDITNLKKALKEANRELENSEKRSATLQEKYQKEASRGKKSHYTKLLNMEEKYREALRSSQQSAGRRLEAQKNLLTNIKRTNEALGVQAQKEKVIEAGQKRQIKLTEQQRKARQDLNKETNKGILDAVKAQDRLNKSVQDYGRMQSQAANIDDARTRKSIRMRSDADKMNREFDHNRLTGLAREEVAVNKLQSAYNRAYEKRERAVRRGSQARVIFSPATQQNVHLDIKEAEGEMALLQGELRAMGQIPITQEVDLKLKEEHGGAGLFARLAKALTGTAVRLGPFTTSMGTLIKALALLGPIVTGVVGHLGALAAVLGAGLAGAAGTAGAAIAGFALSLGGVGLAMPKLLNDFKSLNTLQKAYHTQVLKTGANSDKAKTKLKEFNHALGEVPPSTLKTFNAINKLSKEWGDFTKTLRPDFYRGLASGVKTVGELMPWFEKNTATAFKNVTNGWNGWMKRLRSDKATEVLGTLGKNANASIRPLMKGLGNLAAAFGKISASFSKELPGLFRGFERWTGAMNDSLNDTKNLDSKTHNLVESMRSLGHFTQAVGHWLVALFAPGVDVGKDAIDGYTEALDRATGRMKSGEGRDRLVKFFREATDTSEKFIRAIAPFAQMFFEWTTIMRPFTNVLVWTIGLFGKLAAAVTSFGPAKVALQGAFGIFLWGTLAKRVVEVGRSMGALYGTMKAMKGLGTIGAIKGGVVKFLTGGAIRGATPANPLFVMQVGGGSPVGGKTPGKVPGGGGPGVIGRLPNFARLAGGIGLAAGAAVALGVALDKIADKRNAEKNAKQVERLVSARNIEGIRDLQREYEKFGKTPPPNLQKAIDQIQRLNDQDLHTLRGEVRDTWSYLDKDSTKVFKHIKDAAAYNFRLMKGAMKTNSEGAASAASLNFHQASKAIKTAIKEGRISSKTGLAEIRKMWVTELGFYGFSPKEARQVAKGNRFDGGRNEGARDSGIQYQARGGLTTVGGRAGVRAHDNVPAMLNGQPSMVAKGEQVAVFNRHQQKAMDGMMPGGLSGFFARNNRPHYMAQGGIAGRYASGGIVPVPGFPGESAASSVIGMITKIAHMFRLTLTDAFGSGHKSPGHTVTGTAADFSGPDANMGRAVKWLVSQGYLVGYDGSYGSQNWPGHGPSTKTPNYHLHVELGGKGALGSSGDGFGAVIDAIKTPQAVQGFGGVSELAQRVLGTAAAAATSNITDVAGTLAVPTAGGSGGVGGGGAASRAQMVRWAKTALMETQALGHGGATPGNVAKILELAMKESSWIPNSINNWDINAKNGNPSGGLMHVTLDKVGGSKARLFDPITNMVASIRYQISKYKRLITFSPYAQGGLVGERGKEMVADHKTGAVRMVNQPTIMGLSGSQAVIPRGEKGGPFMERLASSLGIPAYDKGRQPNMNQGEGNAKHRASAKKKKRKAMKGSNPEKIPSVIKYRGLLDKEDRQNTKIEILDRTVREPDELVIPDPSGAKDAAGEPVMVENTKEIARWRKELNNLIAAQEHMYGGKNSILAQIKKQFTPVSKDLKAYRDLHHKNKDKLEKAIRDDKALIAKPLKGPNKKHLAKQQEKARARLQRNKNKLDKEKDALSNEKDTRSDINDDHQDLLDRRIPTASLDREDQIRIRDGIAKQVAGAMPDTGGAGGAGGDEGLTYGGQQAVTSQLLAAITRDFGPNFSGTQNIPLGGVGGPGGAQGLQANPTQIGSVVSALGSAVGGSSGFQAAASASIGGGFSGSGTSDAISSAQQAAGGGISAAGIAPVQSSGPATVNKSVVINNSFQTQPADPMTWANGVSFEAGNAI